MSTFGGDRFAGGAFGYRAYAAGGVGGGGAAAARVGGATGFVNSGTTITLTMPSYGTADGTVAVSSSRSSNANTATITDSSGETWTAQVDATIANASSTHYIWTAPWTSAMSGATVTITWTGSNQASAVAEVWENATFDQVTTSTGASGTTETAPAATAGSSSIVVLAFGGGRGNADGTSYTLDTGSGVASGYTNAQATASTAASAARNTHDWSASKTQTGTSVTSAVFTLTGSIASRFIAHVTFAGVTGSSATSGTGTASGSSSATATATTNAPPSSGSTKSMSDFAFTFDIATDSTAVTAEPTYTSMAAYVAMADPMQMTRGRESEQNSTANPGRASVTLKNTDGRFTYGNGSSPYAPIQLRRPCRFGVTYQGVPHDLWHGFVDTWGNNREQTTGRATLNASDRMARLSPVKMPALLDAEILADHPSAYYPLDDPSESVKASDRSAQYGVDLSPRQYGDGGSLAFGAGLVGPDGQTQAAFTPASTTSGRYLTTESANLAGDFTTAALEAVVWISPTADLSAAAQVAYWGSSAAALKITMQSDFTMRDGATASAGRAIVPGALLHLAVTKTSDGLVTYYINGEQAGTSTATDPATAITTGKLHIGGNPDGTVGPFDGRISHVACYRTAPSPARIYEHARVALNAHRETTAARFQRIARVIGLPTSGYAVEGTTSKFVGAQSTTDTSALSLLTELATAEGGSLHVSKAGVLTFSTANARYNRSTSLTLDAAQSGQVLADSIDFRVDPDDLVNVAVAQGVNGGKQRSANAASIAAYDTHEVSESLPLDDPAIVLNWTQNQVARFSQPRQRCESVEVDVVAFANSGGNVANLLEVGIGSRMQITNMPTDMAASSTLDLFIEGVSPTVTKNTFRIKFLTSPVSVEDGIWKVGTSRIGVSTRLGY